jgi:molybdate transport system ATP-binding protein
MGEESVLIVDFSLSMQGFELRPSFEMGSTLTVIFGESGAGKSLTLRVIAGLGPPVEGAIQLHGKILQDSQKGIRSTPQERKIGYIPHNYGLSPPSNRRREHQLWACWLEP